MSFRILLVDDSRLVRTAVADILNDIPGVELFGEAANGKECLDLLADDMPDLIIMDVEMPVMDGIATLKELRKRGIEVKILMLSVLTIYGALTTFRAMDLGAMDFLPKPSPDSGLSLADISELLRIQIEGLIEDHQSSQQKPIQIQKPEIIVESSSKPKSNRFNIIVIGISTGGPPALQQLLENLNENLSVPILIVQHMPPIFTKAFAERLDEQLQLKVCEATEGQIPIAGHVYIAPGDFHMELLKHAEGCQIHLTQAALRHSHRPSVDITMEQATALYGSHVLGIIMTGMGNDGVAGMKCIHEAGGKTLAQDQKSSVIFGMNKRAIEAGAVDQVLPLHEIAARINELDSGGL